MNFPTILAEENNGKRDARQSAGAIIILCLFVLIVGIILGGWDFIASTWWLGLSSLGVAVIFAKIS
ncbi:MAG: hypothetical protein AB8E87_03465 [Prochlorococcus sp.]